jgi:predicted O-methyltransferase YrrM
MVQMNRKLADYVHEVGFREPDVLLRLREATDQHQHSGWATDPEQTQLLALIAQMIGARCVVEVGTFTGYTSLAFALALPKDGRARSTRLSSRPAPTVSTWPISTATRRTTTLITNAACGSSGREAS